MKEIFSSVLLVINAVAVIRQASEIFPVVIDWLFVEYLNVVFLLAVVSRASDSIFLSIQEELLSIHFYEFVEFQE